MMGRPEGLCSGRKTRFVVHVVCVSVSSVTRTENLRRCVELWTRLVTYQPRLAQMHYPALHLHTLPYPPGPTLPSPTRPSPSSPIPTPPHSSIALPRPTRPTPNHHTPASPCPPRLTPHHPVFPFRKVWLLTRPCAHHGRRGRGDLGGETRSGVPQSLFSTPHESQAHRTRCPHCACPRTTWLLHVATFCVQRPLSAQRAY